jgi:hypothetical protein
MPLASPWSDEAVEKLAQRLYGRDEAGWSAAAEVLRERHRATAREHLNALAPYVPQSLEEQRVDPLDGLDWTERGALVVAVDTMIATDDAHSPEMHAALLRLTEKLPRLNEAALDSPQQQSPEPNTGLGDEDRERLERIATRLESVDSPDAHLDAKFLRQAASEAPSGGREQGRVEDGPVVSEACTRGDHGHCVYWICAQRCTCKCHRSAALSDHQGTGGAG